MVYLQRNMRRAFILLLPLTLSALFATPASAAVTADFAMGVLTVVGDAEAMTSSSNARTATLR
jgi:hypothetical protein